MEQQSAGIARILERLHIDALNDMQQKAFRGIAETNNDVIILSPTGSGKTLAYLLPLVGLIDASRDDVQAMVIVPGRELALQSDTVLKVMACGVRSVCCYGGRAAMDEHRTIRAQRPHIVFGTPGRLNDHLDKENISPYGVRYVIIDEFDKCLQMGFHDEMSRLLKKLPGVRRKILLSATDAEQMPDFVHVARALRIDCLPEAEQVSDRVALNVVKSPTKDKLETLCRLLGEQGDRSSIVFLNYRESVERTAGYLKDKGFAVSLFHGGLDQKAREDALYRFSNGSANVLVSTDLASRGLDVPDIDNIIHYHLPQTADEYIHRVGRTARWDAHGRAYFIIGPDEYVPEFVEGEVEECGLSEDIVPPVPAKMCTLYIGKGKKDKLSKGDIVGFLCKIGGLKADEIGRIDVKDRYTYVAIARPKLRQVLRQTAGEKIKGIKTVVEEVL